MAESEKLVRLLSMWPPFSHPMYIAKMATLNRLDEMGGDAPLEEIRKASGFTRSAFARVVRVLLKDGGIEKFADQDDGRRCWIHITGAGHAMIEGTLKMLYKFNDEAPPANPKKIPVGSRWRRHHPKLYPKENERGQ